jgi:hypothetical protein
MAAVEVEHAKYLQFVASALLFRQTFMKAAALFVFAK